LIMIPKGWSIISLEEKACITQQADIKGFFPNMLHFPSKHESSLHCLVTHTHTQTRYQIQIHDENAATVSLSRPKPRFVSMALTLKNLTKKGKKENATFHVYVQEKSLKGVVEREHTGKILVCLKKSRKVLHAQ